MSVLKKKPSGTGVVLYYHSIALDQRNNFAKQMDCVLKHAKPVSADIGTPLEKGVHHAAVTFDDGFLCVVGNALPELAKRNIPSTLFVPSANLGQHPKWIKDKESRLRHEIVISAEQLKRLNHSNLVSIGSHCITHSNLLMIKNNEAKKEIFKSKNDLEDILKDNIKLLSFPHGAYSQIHVEWARKAGYERVFTILPTLAFSDPEEYVTGRVNVDPNDWRLEFKLKLLGAYRWLPMAFSVKRKIHSLFKRFTKQPGIQTIK